MGGVISPDTGTPEPPPGRRRRRLATETAARYWSRGGPNWAAAIGLRLLFALIPVAVLSALIAGAILPGAGTSSRLLGGTVSREVSRAVGDLSTAAHSLGWLAALGLLWTGSTLFSCMETAAAAVYGIPARPFLRQRLLGIGLMFAFVAAIVTGVAASLLLDSASAQHLRILGGPGVALVAAGALYALLLRALPNRPLRWRDVAPGVVLGAVLTVALNLVWPAVGRYVSGGAALSHAVLAVLITLAAYVYVTAEIIVLALALNATVAERRPAAAGLPAPVETPGRQATVTAALR